MPYLGSEPAQAALVAADIADGAVTTAKLNSDAVTNAKLADDTLDSEHYVDGSIDTAHVADDAVTLAKMAAGTDGNIISYDTSGNPVAVATGTDGQVLTSSGAGAVCAFETISGVGYTSATIQAHGGAAAINFTSIPSGTTEILVMLDAVGMDNQAGGIGCQIGDSGGLETSGYLGTASRLDGGTATSQAVTTHFGMAYFSGDGAARTMSAILTLHRYDADTFKWKGTCLGHTENGYTLWDGGSKTLSAELDRVTILCVNSATAFDAGAMRILYK